MTTASTRNHSKTVECLLQGVVCVIAVQGNALIDGYLSTHGPNPSSIGVNDAAADFGPRGQAKLGSGFTGELSNNIASRRPVAVLILSVFSMFIVARA